MFHISPPYKPCKWNKLKISSETNRAPVSKLLILWICFKMIYNTLITYCSPKPPQRIPELVPHHCRRLLATDGQYMRWAKNAAGFSSSRSVFPCQTHSTVGTQPVPGTNARRVLTSRQDAASELYVHRQMQLCSCFILRHCRQLTLYNTRSKYRMNNDLERIRKATVDYCKGNRENWIARLWAEMWTGNHHPPSCNTKEC
jgi:hypothetical protein